MSRALVTTMCVVALILGATTLAGAGPIAPASQRLASGSTTVASCGSLSGVVSNFTIAAGKVTAVSLTSIPTTCNGGSLSVTLTNGTTSLGSGGPVAVAAGAAAVTMSPTVTTGSVTNLRLVIAGP